MKTNKENPLIFGFFHTYIEANLVYETNLPSLPPSILPPLSSLPLLKFCFIERKKMSSSSHCQRWRNSKKESRVFLMFKKTRWRKILKIFKEKKEKITKILVMCNFFFLQKTRVSRINCHRSLTPQSTSKKSKMKNITQRFFQILKANLSTIYIQF